MPGLIASKRLAVAVLVALLLIRPGTAETLAGRIVAIADGDSLTLLTSDRREVRIRIASIDAPEHAQPYGDRSQRALAALAFGQAVVAEIVDIDRYGRTVADVRCNGLDLGSELVRSGAAWVFQRYSRNPALLALEAEARDAHRGLWGLPEGERTPPWEWRQARRPR